MRPITMVLPSPIADLRHVHAVLSEVPLMFGQLIAQCSSNFISPRADRRHAVDHIGDEMAQVSESTSPC